MLRRGQGNTNQHFLPQDSKSNLAGTVAATAAVRRQDNGTSDLNFSRCDSHGASVLPYIYLIYIYVYIYKVPLRDVCDVKSRG